VLSGGERRRLSLAILVHSGANVLVLDEPTNHLDLESREALEQALAGFQGAILLVSHDRALLDAVGTRTVAIEPDEVGKKRAGSLRSYVGGWAEYVRVREERAAAKAQARSHAKSHAKSQAKSGGRSDATPLPKSSRKAKASGSPVSQEKLEQQIETAEAALRVVEDELADPAAWSGAEASARSAARHEQARRAVEQLYERLERVSG
jgi:ATP-binding cassette subfamily F protein 3